MEARSDATPRMQSSTLCLIHCDVTVEHQPGRACVIPEARQIQIPVLACMRRTLRVCALRVCAPCGPMLLVPSGHADVGVRRVACGAVGCDVRVRMRVHVSVPVPLPVPVPSCS